MRSLYAHFPFCETKCHYCDFYSLAAGRTTAHDRARFAEALSRETALQGQRLAPVLDTIFLGGGTPSMTDPAVMAESLKPLWSRTSVGPGTEWTMEANPSSIDRARMEGYRALGVNRVSMGVQSLRDDHLALLGRVHDGRKAFESLTALFEAGFDNVSVDLLCGVPGQTTQDLADALTALTRFPITHLSCYLLTLPPHHRMHKDLPGEETQLEHLLFIDRWLTEAGFDHYEISNFAKPGKRARHNLAYWKGDSYLGLGPSAHSFDASQGLRWKNFSSLHRYADMLAEGKPPVEWSESLTPEQKNLERWMLALRLDEGFPKAWTADPARTAKVERLLGEGLLIEHPGDGARFRLTARGYALSDQVIGMIS